MQFERSVSQQAIEVNRFRGSLLVRRRLHEVFTDPKGWVEVTGVAVRHHDNGVDVSEVWCVQDKP